MHCGYRALLLHLVHSMTHTHTWCDHSGRRLARRRDLYQTQYILKRQTSIPPAGFKPLIPTSKRPQTYPFERAVTGISFWHIFQESITHFYSVILPCMLCPRDVTAHGQFVFAKHYFLINFLTSDEFRHFVVIISSPSKSSLSAWTIGRVP